MQKNKTLMLSAALMTLLTATATPANAVDLVSLDIVSVETAESSSDSIVLRKLVEPNKGFKTGVFKWNPATNSYTLSGMLKADDSLYGKVELWKHYLPGQTTLQSESIAVYGGGLNVQSIEFKSPKGVVYTVDCADDGIYFGFNTFACGKSNLPVRQTEFGNGKYVITYTLANGSKVVRNYYVSGAYPTLFNINYPTNGSINIPVAPTLIWTAVGAAGYDISIEELVNNTPINAYAQKITGSVNTVIKHTVPANLLKPQTNYILTIEANSPLVNGGTKGYKKTVAFTTAP